MDKLKIVKIAVFLLTFCLIFLLCFAVSQIILKSNRPAQAFKISLPAANSRVSGMLAEGNRLFIATDIPAVYVVNLKDASLEGTIYLNGENHDGKEKQMQIRSFKQQ